MADNVKTLHSGDANTTEYRVFFERNGQAISPFHDIPLHADEANNIFNMVVEIPRGTNAKMEIATSLPLNPIKQDVKNGKLRFVDDVFPYTGYIWNYGAFPQTWEDPSHLNPETKAKGDNDPLDVCEIGSEIGFRGQIKQVKALGVIALIDEGETDWKVIAIDINDPLAAQLNDIDDVQRLLPGFTMATYEWFRTYKIPAGKPPNEFAFHGEAKNRAYAHEVIRENNEFWKRLVFSEGPHKLSGLNTTLADSPHRVESFSPEIADFVPSEKAPVQGAAVADGEANGLKAHVELSQRRHPHGTADLSAAVAAAQAGQAGEVGSYRVVAGPAREWGQSWGIFHPLTPHRLPKAGATETEELAGAAVSVRGGEGFAYATGQGTFFFSVRDGTASPSEAFAIPETPADADQLGEALPLAFLRN